MNEKMFKFTAVVNLCYEKKGLFLLLLLYWFISSIRCHRVYCICFYVYYGHRSRIILFLFILHSLQAIQYHQSWYGSCTDVQCISMPLAAAGIPYVLLISILLVASCFSAELRLAYRLICSSVDYYAFL